MRKLHSEIDREYGDRRKGICIYGSRARGDARLDGDMDVAVAPAGEVDE